MSDLKNIASKHLESAAKLQETSLKYIISFGLLILFCAVFAESVYRKTKFDTIRLNVSERKANSLAKAISQAFTSKAKGDQAATARRDSLLAKRKTLNRQMGEIDSAYKDTYQTVEDNLPSGLKFILRQATHRPYGILLTALIAFGFLWYLFDLRKRYFRKLSVGLRILKEEDNGYNKIYDYNLVMPFWAFPIQKTESKTINKQDILHLAGVTRHERLYNAVTCLLLLGLSIIQIRLFGISLLTNDYKLDWILIIQSFVLVFTIVLIVLWLIPAPFDTRYNFELVKARTPVPKVKLAEEDKQLNRMSRRNLLLLAAGLVAGGVMGYLAGPASRRISAAMLQPRVRRPKTVNKNRRVMKAENEAKALMKNGKLADAAKGIVAALNRDKNHLVDYTRLFDLLFILCQKDKAIFTKYYHTMKQLANNSGSKLLAARIRCWEPLATKKQQKIRKRSSWDGNGILAKDQQQQTPKQATAIVAG